MSESRVTVAGTYLELGDAANFVTVVGTYLELGDSATFVTVAGVYLEIIPAQSRVTVAGVYVEILEYAPDAPTLLTATAASDGQIDLSWTDNSLIEDGFEIERSPNGTTGWVNIGTTSANDTTFSNTGLTPSTTYYYRVYAYNGNGDSGYSNTASATTASAPQMVYDIRHQVYFDWDRDGTYTSEDDYLVSARGSHRLSPPGQSITSTSGRVSECTIVLANHDGRFSSFNASGPLYAYLQSGRTYHVPVIVQISIEPAVSVSTTYNRVFTGVARIPSESTLSLESIQTITFDCRGNEEIYLNKRDRTLQSTFKTYYDDGVTESEFIENTLLSLGVDSGDLEIDEGIFTIPFAWIENESVVEALWQLSALTGGRFYCNKAGEYCYESSTHWLIGTEHITSQYTYARGTGFQNLTLLWDETELAEEISVSYTERGIGQSDVIYDSDHLQVGSGVTKIVYADFSNAVYEIVSLEYTAGTNGGTNLASDVSVTPTYYAQSAKLVIVNSGSKQANVRVKINGKVVENGETQTIAPESVDSFWTDKIGRSRKINGSTWIQSEGQADMLSQLLRARQDDPTLVAKLTKCSGVSTRALGDRITIVDTELDLSATDFYVTGISWTYSSRGYFQDIESIRCSDCYPHESTSPGYFKIGTNKLGVADALRARVFF